MVSNKKRLYIALYPSGVATGAERRYHWAFLVGPKKEQGEQVPGMRYHVKNPHGRQWVYEEMQVENVRTTNNLLVRMVIAKITDEARLVQVLRSVPVVQGDPSWRCRTWIQQALEAIRRDGKCVGTAELDWVKIEETAREYAGAKIDAGRFRDATKINHPKPTWDILESKELVP